MKYDIAESYNSFSKRRKDLFGIFDIVAINKQTSIVGVQVCGTDWQPHMRKIKASIHAKWWVEAGGQIWLIGWRELKSGWKSRIYKFERGDFQTAPSHPLSLSLAPDISAL